MWFVLLEDIGSHVHFVPGFILDFNEASELIRECGEEGVKFKCFTDLASAEEWRAWYYPKVSRVFV